MSAAEFDLLIRGAKTVAPDGGLIPVDVGVRDGIIAALETGADRPDGPASAHPAAANRVLEAAGLVLLPGIIDLHTHLRSPRGEAGLFAGETASAVAGGVTTVGDFAYPAGSRFELEFEAKRQRLESEALCDFCLHTVVRSPEQLEQATTRTVKVFLAASGLGGQASGGQELIRRGMAKGHQVLAHVEATSDYLDIAQHLAGTTGSTAGGLHIVHVPHQRMVQLLSSLGDPRLTLETCPHYLLWEWVRGRNGCDVNPPIVPADLWSELRAGRIQTIGTDHCSYTRQEKEELKLPGFPGLEASLRLLFTFGVQAERITWGDLCRLLSAAPARVLGLYPRKGALQVGSDADLVLFDPDCEEVMGEPRYGRGDFAPYAGLMVRGRVARTLVRGREVYADGVADLGAAGWGRWQEPQ